MAHFAQLDENNVVTQTIVVPNEVLYGSTGEEDENLGISYCKNLFGENTKWVQTSYNDNFRVRYAVPGFSYDEENDVFLFPRPDSFWTLNTETYEWDPPIPMPEFIDEFEEYIQSFIVEPITGIKRRTYRAQILLDLGIELNESKTGWIIPEAGQEYVKS